MSVLCVQTGGAGSVARSMWREEGHGADLSAVSSALISLLLGYLDAALPCDQQHSGQAAAAEEDMQVCFSLFRLCTDNIVLCCCFQWLVTMACCCACLIPVTSYLTGASLSRLYYSNTDKN